MGAERAARAPGSRSRGDASTSEPKERIRAEAQRLGFDAIGFARADAHPDAPRLRAWLDARRHGTMAWMARDPARRSDPRSLLDGAVTVISVAAGYYRGDWPEADGAARGRVARYAWGGDYHKRMKRRVVRLARSVRELGPGGAWLAAVDTKPLLERGWAMRAGIGWIGKHANLIRPGAGSWCFLGEIVTAIAIEPDEPATDHCGTCARCIPACPTGAIVAPYTLDARRCISYLTIEHRGPIPLELRPLIGTRIFGCDDCQEACPWNRFATPAAHPDFAERPEQQTPELIPLLALDDDAFLARFGGTAIRRAGRNRFVRNVAVALGNLGDPRAVPALERAAREDPDADVREHAAWALARIRGG
ncbi:MAG: tRNA epoxyqueuosine(34) reductase QueG [Hyphomicrobiales bacterium]